MSQLILNTEPPLSFNNVEMHIGDNVIALIARHLRNSKIERIDFDGFNYQIKMVGLKTLIHPMSCVKLDETRDQKITRRDNKSGLMETYKDNLSKNLAQMICEKMNREAGFYEDYYVEKM